MRFSYLWKITMEPRSCRFSSGFMFSLRIKIEKEKMLGGIPKKLMAIRIGWFSLMFLEQISEQKLVLEKFLFYFLNCERKHYVFWELRDGSGQKRWMILTAGSAKQSSSSFPCMFYVQYKSVQNSVPGHGWAKRGI